MSQPTISPGDSLPLTSQQISRRDLVAYAGVSGDLNPIHWDEAQARAVGLPGVVAHGMYSMAVAARAVSGLAGGPGRIRRLRVRFPAPVLSGETLTIQGQVVQVDGNRALVRFSGTSDTGTRVLAKGEAELDLG